MSRTLKLFLESKYYSTKLIKYFKLYDDLFSKYINKKIIFVEIGILNGGSLQIWKKFFGNKARIIGIDQNKEYIDNAKNSYGNRFQFLHQKFSQDFFASNSFDVIKYNDVLNEPDFLQIKKILKCNGILILTNKYKLDDQFINLNDNSFIYRKL
jgi:2-polyprenyl-3-methyl-5-hydroxy-6-metoxy-1,4-benzoquinol methylase